MNYKYMWCDEGGKKMKETINTNFDERFAKPNLTSEYAYKQFWTDIISKIKDLLNESMVRENKVLKNQYDILATEFNDRIKKDFIIKKLHKLDLKTQGKFYQILLSYKVQFHQMVGSGKSVEDLFNLTSWLRLMSSDIEMMFEIMYSKNINDNINIVCEECENVDIDVKVRDKYVIGNVDDYKNHSGWGELPWAG